MCVLPLAACRDNASNSSDLPTESTVSLTDATTPQTHDNSTESPTTAPTQAPSPDAPVLTAENGKGAVPLGCTPDVLLSELRAKGIQPVLPENVEMFAGVTGDGGVKTQDGTFVYYTEYASYGFYPLEGNEPDNRILQYVEMNKPNYVTEKGLRMGDTVEQMRAIYGAETSAYQDWEFSYNTEGGALRFIFEDGCLKSVLIDF